jgi:hypothetical protein
MNFMQLGRRGNNNSPSHQYSMVPLMARNGNQNNPDDEPSHSHDQDNSSEGEDEPDELPDIDNTAAAIQPTPVANNRFVLTALEQDHLRRQQILRFGLIICMIFFLFDGGNYDNVNNEFRGNSSKQLIQSMDEIQLANTRDVQDIRSILLPIRTSDFTKQNVTGMYKGNWKMFSPNHNHSISTSREYVTLSIIIYLTFYPNPF